MLKCELVEYFIFNQIGVDVLNPFNLVLSFSKIMVRILQFGDFQNDCRPENRNFQNCLAGF